MARRRIIATLFLLIYVADVRSQFFDFFNLSPLVQNYQTQKPRNTAATKRPKIESIQVTNHRQEQTVKKITSVTYTVDESVENGNTRQNSREKDAKRKNQNNNQNKQNIFTLAPINFNFYTTTAKPVRKTTKNPSSQRYVTENANKTKAQRISHQRLPSDYDLYDGDRWFDRPAVNNINEPYEITTRPYYNNNYNNQNYGNEYSNPNNNNQFTTKKPNYSYTTATTKRSNVHTTKNPYAVANYNTYTTKNPYYYQPGVKPAVPAILENLPPITNKPVTNRPVTNKPYTTRPVNKVTNRPVSIPAIPTDAGAISFPEDDVAPEVTIGPNEDDMSDSENRRYIELAERMCDKYKSLNTKQLQAIPLLPSPEPVQVNVSSCAPIKIPLVVYGKVVKIDEFPHMALLGWLKLEGAGYSWKCGGSLVSEQYVMTASHCSYQERDNTVVSGPPRAVQLGSSYLDDSGALVVRVAAVVRHPKYKSPRSYYDVALLKLRHPVTFSQVIKPACLGVPPPVNEPIIATGWGRTEFSDQSLELRSVSLPIWDINKCAEVLGTSRKLPNGPSSESQVCAGEMRGRKDTCQGDSGGPAQIQDGCIWRVVAITSLGRSCGAPNTPGLYAKVPIAFVAAQVFGNYKSTPTTEMNNQNNYNNNQQGHNNDQQEYYNKNQQGYNSNQNYQNYNQQQNNYNNNQRRDNRNDDSNYNYQTSTNKVYRSDENNYNNQNYNYNNARRDEAGTFKNHRNVDVYTATNPNNNQGYNENDRNYNTDVNAYSNQQNYENNYNNNHRRDYRNYNNQNDYNYNNRNGDYNRNVNQQSYNVRDIGSDNSRIWIT